MSNVCSNAGPAPSKLFHVHFQCLLYTALILTSTAKKLFSTTIMSNSPNVGEIGRQNKTRVYLFKLVLKHVHSTTHFTFSLSPSDANRLRPLHTTHTQQQLRSVTAADTRRIKKAPTISQGKEATRLRYGEIFNDDSSIRNLLLSSTVKGLHAAVQQQCSPHYRCWARFSAPH